MQALTRFRWRRRGAWQWPTFAAVLIADTAVLHELPIAGSGVGVGVAGALLLSGFFNVLVVAVAGPLLAVGLRRRRRDLPRVIARDYSATAVLLAVTAILAGLGLSHRPAVLEARQAFAAQSAAVRRYVHLQAPLYLPRIDAADSIRIDDQLFRTCVPGPDRARSLCLFIDTSNSPPGVTRDPSQVPNSQ